ncbi:MAG: hypothetical protein AB7K68_10035 [Bacteriovoracia bacterium]
MLPKRIFLFLLLFFGVFAVVGGFYLRSRVEPLVKQKLQEACPSCKINWGSFSFGLRGVSFRDLEFESPPRQITRYSAKVRRLDIVVNWRQAKKKLLDLRSVAVDGADIKVMEIEGHNPPGPGPQALFAIRGITFSDSTFTYEIREKGKFGRVRLDKIQASISALGTFPELKDQPVVGKAKARLEQSGQVDLEVEAPLFRDIPKVLVKLSLADQRLPELNEYFTPIDGVELSGRVIQGNASAEVDGKLLSAWADIRYEKFDVRFLRTKQRGGLKAFLSNIVADLKLDPKKVTADSKSVGIHRRPLESMVSFVLRGLKEAALKVATI